MIPKAKLIFHGDPTRRNTTTRNPDAPQGPVPYIVSPQLIEAVNLAIHAHRPLLLEGEAGCGKSTLALAVADELGLPLYRWDVRSTSTAQEGFYTYDALRRLHDNQLRGTDRDASTMGDPANPMDYVTFGAIGQAFGKVGTRSVVLIDEIDKADIDFPNDLLNVLDSPWAFTIPEAGHRRIKADEQCLPIVFVTSNKERGNLPMPFLRRCVYAFVTFPDDRLEEIVRVHGLDADPELTKAAADRLRELRSSKELFKNPGTSEFIDWVEALVSYRPNSCLDELVTGLPVPFPQLLFKMRGDYLRHAGSLT